MSDIPEEYDKKLRKIATRRGMNIDDIRQDFLDFFNSDYVQNDPQFRNDEERYNYTSMAIQTQYQYRFPVEDYMVVPIGIGGRYKTSNGWRADIYAFVKEGGGTPLRRVSLMGKEYSKTLSDINLFSKYNVKLGKYQNSNDYKADTRARWEDPEHFGIEASDVIDRLGLKRYGVLEVTENPSKKSGDYIVSTDWRSVRGMISYAGSGDKKTGGKWHRYNVIDGECDERMSNDGKVINENMTAWSPKRFFGYPRLSLCDFLGTVKIDENGLPTMNCYLVNLIKEGREE